MKILLSMDWFKMAGVKQRNTKHEEKLATGFVFHFNDGYFFTTSAISRQNVTMWVLKPD